MEITEKTTLVEGSKIYYRTLGDQSKPLMVFLPGWPGIYLERSGVLQELAKDHYVVSPEHPGLLRSDPLPRYSDIFSQYADVVKDILKQERLDLRKAVVMGQSFGGGIASAYAEKFPETVSALVLTDSVIGAGRVSSYMKFLYYLGPKLLPLSLYLPDVLRKKVLFMVFGVEATDSKKALLARLAMVNCYTNQVTKGYWEKNKKIIDRDYSNFPIVMVWGNRDGKEFNMYGACHVDDAKELAWRMEKEGRKVKFFEVEGGHTILYENPKMVIDKVRSGLRSII